MRLPPLFISGIVHVEKTFISIYRVKFRKLCTLILSRRSLLSGKKELFGPQDREDTSKP